MKNFKNTIETKTGVKVHNLIFNATAKIWVGLIWNGKKWVSCAWFPSGKCINKLKPNLNLI